MIFFAIQKSCGHSIPNQSWPGKQKKYSSTQISN